MERNHTIIDPYPARGRHSPCCHLLEQHLIAVPQQALEDALQRGVATPRLPRKLLQQLGAQRVAAARPAVRPVQVVHEAVQGRQDGRQVSGVVLQPGQAGRLALGQATERVSESACNPGLRHCIACTDTHMAAQHICNDIQSSAG